MKPGLIEAQKLLFRLTSHLSLTTPSPSTISPLARFTLYRLTQQKENPLKISALMTVFTLVLTLSLSATNALAQEDSERAERLEERCAQDPQRCGSCAHRSSKRSARSESSCANAFVADSERVKTRVNTVINADIFNGFSFCCVSLYSVKRASGEMVDGEGVVSER